jgi:hypothetical protein
MQRFIASWCLASVAAQGVVKDDATLARIKYLSISVHLRENGCQDHQTCIDELIKIPERPADHWDAQAVKKFTAAPIPSLSYTETFPLYDIMATANFCASNGRCARCSACRLNSMAFDGKCPAHCFRTVTPADDCVRASHEPLVVGICSEVDQLETIDGKSTAVEAGSTEMADKDLEQIVYENSAYGGFMRFIAESLPMEVEVHPVRSQVQ